MKHRIARAAALAITGTTLFTSASAIADPAIYGYISGSPAVSGDTGALGQDMVMGGTDCIDPVAGAPTYWGEFVSMDGDPSVTPSWQPYEVAADETGAFEWQFQIPLDNSVGTFYARWYCTTAPATALDDPAMLWVGPVGTMTITGDAQPNALRSTGTASTPGVTYSVDPESLPLVDRIGIPGDQAAKLKAQVDERYEDVARVQRMYGVFFGRHADRGGLDFWVRQLATKSAKTVAAGMAGSAEFKRGYGSLSDDAFVAKLYENTLGRGGDPAGRNFWGNRLSSKKQSRTDIALAFADSSEYIRRTASANYVVAAFQVLTGRTPSPAEIATHVERLEAGGIKVQLVEDIALSAHDAAWWAARS